MEDNFSGERHSRRRWLFSGAGSVAILTIALVAGGVSVAYAGGALSPGADNSYVGCVNNATKILRIVGDPSQCSSLGSVISLAGPQQPHTTSVNCAAGQSIQAALNAAPVNLPLTVNITGTCTEAVTIPRDEVNLVGASPGAGITAPNPNVSPLTVQATHVSISGLTVTGGWNGIQTMAGAVLAAGNIHISSAHVGVWVGDGSSATLFQATIDQSRQAGLVVASGASADTTNSTISGSAFNGITVQSAHLALFNTTVTGTGSSSADKSHGGGIGVEVQTGGSLNADHSTVTNSTATGVHAWNGGTINFGHGTIQNNGGGGLLAQDGGVANVQATHVTGNSMVGLSAMEGGRLTVQDGTTIDNNQGDGVDITGNSMGSLEGPNVISHNSGNGIWINALGVAVFSYAGDSNQIIDNAGWGLTCGTAGAFTQYVPGTVSGNGAGQNNCTAA